MQTTKNNLKDFQLSGNQKDKASKEYGAKMVDQIEDHLNAGYFSERNRRFRANEALAAGRMDMDKFKNLMDMEGKINYVNISWKPIMIVNTIISRLVGRWMQRLDKVVATAVDPISTQKKKEQIETAEFYLENKAVLEELSAESGAPLIPSDQFVPEDKEHLDLWAHEEQRLPEEILYEKGISSVFYTNGFANDGVNTRRLKHDAAVYGLIGTEAYSDSHGKIHIKRIEPENIIYSHSKQDDFKNCWMKGCLDSLTIGDLRIEYPDLTEEELFDIAKTAKEFNNSGLTWDTGYLTSYHRPYDDWNVGICKFEIKSPDVNKYQMKVTTNGNLVIDKKKKRPEKLSDNKEFYEKPIWNIYRGVYVRETKFILEWGVKKNKITPQDPKYVGEADFSFSFYMYQNTNMRNLAVPEKVEEPVEQMILARLKIQQLVAKMRPSGLLIDVDGLQNIDLGTGAALNPLQVKRIADQTGDLYYRGKDAEGVRQDVPIRENPNAGSVAQLQQLIELYNYHLQVLRDEIGINEFAEGQSIKPRVGQENVQASLEISFNSTDYMNDACGNIMHETAKKTACLLHDSVEFGSEAYREIMNEKDVKKRVYDIKLELLPTQEELAYIERSIEISLQKPQGRITLMDAFKIRRIAKDNIKLAELYLARAEKRAFENEMKQAQMQSQMNGDVQMQSVKAKAEEDRLTLQNEITLRAQISDAESKNKQKELTLSGIFAIYAKGLPMPAELQPLAAEIIKNSAMPLFVENVINEHEMGQMQMPQGEVPEEEQAMM